MIATNIKNFMLNFVTKSLCLVISPGCSAYTCAESYNITINMDDEEYYSDEKGFSEQVSTSKKAKRKSAGSSVPNGKPVLETDGYRLSSNFGLRRDPFNGHHRHHQGIDFAAHQGSKILATAKGRVTWAGSRGGYGNLVEIDHGNGYKTRYGHNEQVFVSVGDAVNQGDVIASLGSTGRSTGPHLHYEIVEQGRKINPVSHLKKTSESIREESGLEDESKQRGDRYVEIID